MRSGPKLKTLEVRFLSKILKKGNNDCWLYTGFKDKDGYGKISGYGDLVNNNSHSISVHRYSFWFYKLKDTVSWEDFRASKKYVCHTCDNPSCCNPEHLFLGTEKDNTQDMIKKGRRHNNKGEKHGKNNKLSNKDVIEIYESSGLQKDLAIKYGVTFQMISRIKRHKAWTHITLFKEGAAGIKEAYVGCSDRPNL